MTSDSIHTPVRIVGGGASGVAAALALAGRGIACVMTEPNDWVGGTLISQAVPPNENRWIGGRKETQAATQSYLDYRRSVREQYRVDRRAPVTWLHIATLKTQVRETRSHLRSFQKELTQAGVPLSLPWKNGLDVELLSDDLGILTTSLGHR